MRFEHDTYDIDVYSLCESVYYSCNNDEYDYVLECVNSYVETGDEGYLDILTEMTNDEAMSKINSIFSNLKQQAKKNSVSIPKNLAHLYKSLSRTFHGDINSRFTLSLDQEKQIEDFHRQVISAVNPPSNTPPTPPPNNTPSQQDTSSTDNNSNKGNFLSNNKGKIGLGVGAAAIGGGIYAYKQYRNRPKSVIAKRIAALRGIYKKFMINAQRNPQKAKAKILSVIDKLLHYMQNKADGR